LAFMSRKRGSVKTSKRSSRKSSSRTSAASRKKIVQEFFGALGNPRDALKFFAPDARQHNPYVKGGMDALMDSMAAAQKSMAPQFDDPDFSVENILVDGDVAAAHTNLVQSKSRPEEGGLRQVHLFRFNSNNKIVEYWDVTQTITKDMPNSQNAF
jgi:predicted SnoaL-like aldol condensation-catalyzing enzyme